MVKQVCQVRRSWDRNGGRTAVLLGSMMILSVFVPHGGYDEENYIAELEIVKIVMEKGGQITAEDFFNGGDLNIELKRDGGDENISRY